MRKIAIYIGTLFAAFCSFSAVFGQFELNRFDQYPVTLDGSQIKNPWVGGLNFCQFSNIDLNMDGTQDLFVFDRTGNRVITYIQNGSSGQSDLQHTTEYDSVFPFYELHDWALLIDYNCDGKKDIFSYSVGGIRVYKNTSNTIDGLQFEIATELVYSNYDPSEANLFVTSVDLPALIDVDNDGDIDILTFSIFGSYVEYHKNFSMENYGTCDSLDYMIRNRCWGYFSENANTNSVNLLDSCNYNVVDPEMEEIVELFHNEQKKAQPDPGILDDLENRLKAAHSGSSLLSFDSDANGVKELVLGDVSFSNLTFLYNGGTVDNAVMYSQDTAFPVYDVPLDLDIFPGAFYVDVNNDQIRDLLVSPNNRNLSENFESIWYYHNAGADDFPDFEHQMNNFLQDQIIDVGEGAQPIFFDHNGDGLQDLILSNYGYYQENGNYPGKVAYFENIGTAQAPHFELITRDYQDLSTIGLGQGMHLSFGDMDDDGDKDLFIGDVQGSIHYFENVSTGLVADFQLTVPNFPDNLGNAIDIGQFAAPQIFDVNRDQLPDLIIGERNGNINYFENIGSVGNPSMKLIKDTLGGVAVGEWWNITGYATPLMFENENAEYELLVGSEAGYIWHFNDIDNNIGGDFNLVDSLFQGIDEGIRSSITLADVNGDDLLDAVVGNYRGGVGFYKNDFTNSIGEYSGPTRLTVYPNPATDQLVVDLSSLRSAELTVELVDILGKKLFSKKIRSISNYQMNTSDLAPGHYTLMFHSDHGSGIASFIKQ